MRVEMSEYIDRIALGIGTCNPDVFEDKGYAKGWNAAIDIIQNAPAADVRPVVRGVWVKNGWSIRCSICGYDMPFATRNFCPNCGAEMRATDIDVGGKMEPPKEET